MLGPAARQDLCPLLLARGMCQKRHWNPSWGICDKSRERIEVLNAKENKPGVSNENQMFDESAAKDDGGQQKTMRIPV